MTDPVVIATWPFGRTAVEVAWDHLSKGEPALDSAIAGAQAVEDDPKVESVGFGGIANAVGTVQLDACVMDGLTLACGAVAGLENIRPEDTFDVDYVSMLERTSGKGLSSPTGFEPVFWT